MSRVSYDRFRREYLDLVRATRRKNTWVKARQALAELGAAGVRTTADLTPAAVARLVAASRARGRSDVTTHALVRSVQAACSYAVKTGRLRVSPFAVVRDWGLDAEPAELPRHLGRDALARLLGHLAAAATTWKGWRLYALASLVAYTGLRRSEALHLRPEDLDLEAGFLSVPRRRLAHRAKTRTSAARVPLPPAVRPVLAGWLARCGSPWLFPGATRRGPWTGGPPGRKPLDELKAAGLAAGAGPVTFLMLRHSYATHAPAFGLGEIHIKQVLRHTKIRTQRWYVHPEEEALAAAVVRIDFGRPSAVPAPKRARRRGAARPASAT